MSSVTNKYGLSRNIPEDVKLAVRQACGFGCVVCGMSIIEYEHIDPPFHDATVHDPTKIALLCATCHGNVTRKYWSKDKIAEALKAPHCKLTGFSWGAFDIGNQHPVIRFAGVTFHHCKIPVQVRGLSIFEIEEPETPGTPFRLSANFTDPAGAPLFQVRRNEWSSHTNVWDTEFTGGRIIIRDSKHEQSLILRAEPPNGIAVEKLNMQVGPYFFTGDTETLRMHFPGGGVSTLTRCAMDGVRVGMSLS